MQPLSKSYLTPEEYLALERQADDLYDKIEWPGEVLTSTSMRLLRDPAAHYISDEPGFAVRPGPPDWPR